MHPAVLLVAHGSLAEPDSGRVARQLVVQLARFEPGREVRCAFWKEQPALREALATVAAPDVVVVPLFAAKGWFSRIVVPRELGLDTDCELTRRGARRLVRTIPLGAHPALTDLIAARAAEALDAAGLAPEACALVVAGHGTERNPHSARTVLEHAERLRATATFAHVDVGFLDQQPALSTLDARLPDGLEHVIVVPCLVADGPHTRSDLPRALGLPEHRDQSVSTARVGRRVLHYTSAVGTHPDALAVVRACLALGERMLERSDPRRDSVALPDAWHDALTPQRVAAARQALEARLVTEPGVPFVVGQSAALRQADGLFRLVHRSQVRSPSGRETRNALPAEASIAPLARVELLDLPGLSERGADGSHRALRTAADLRRDWCFETDSFARLVDALEIVEPAALTLHPALGGESLPRTSWSACAARHSGLLRAMGECSETQVAALVAGQCEARCTRVPSWHRAPQGASSSAPRCAEPCPLLRAYGASASEK